LLKKEQKSFPTPLEADKINASKDAEEEDQRKNILKLVKRKMKMKKRNSIFGILMREKIGESSVTVRLKLEFLYHGKQKILSLKERRQKEMISYIPNG
jgi:hypothetical protein